MDLFDYNREEQTRREQPRAARMRPRSLDEYIGQDHILAPGRLLRRAIQADQLSSLIFYGPPGTGKTTLASVIAHTTQSHFENLNAVLAGVKDVRRVIEEAQERRGRYSKRTILFVDEVHRWNKAQQDALLPWVENGTIILIGATTENPFFEVNRALVSRSRIFQLKPLTDQDLRRIAHQALADRERGYGALDVRLADEALAHLVQVANGDARAVLNALELAVSTTEPAADGSRAIDLGVAEESIQQRAVLYDKEGDCHFDTVSAFIKSMRGSDPDATMYWLAKMVYAGEDPRFVLRRMLIFAGEDIGLADPQALVVVSAAAGAFDRVGMPEGRYHLAQAALYLATAPKSNSTFAFFDALATVEKEREGEVPNHLRDASRDKEGFGHGQGYLYPHAYRDHWAAQQYLPAGLQGKVFYQPGRLGYECAIADTVVRRREAQLAATVDEDGEGAPPEILTFSPQDRALDRWITRAVSGLGERLDQAREQLFAAVTCDRHSLVIDLRADTGLLALEALRRAPEGGVWALVRTEQAATRLRELVQHLPDLSAPQIRVGDLQTLPDLVDPGERELRFDLALGRNVLLREEDRARALVAIAAALRGGGQLALVETVPSATQRLWRLLPAGSLDKALLDRLAEAEEELYDDASDALVNWGITDLTDLAAEAGFEAVRVTPEPLTSRVFVSPAHLDRWFAARDHGERASYGQRLRSHLSPEEVDEVRTAFSTVLVGREVEWNSLQALLVARRG
jgi:putative ATPase